MYVTPTQPVTEDQCVSVTDNETYSGYMLSNEFILNTGFKSTVYMHSIKNMHLHVIPPKAVRAIV